MMKDKAMAINEVFPNPVVKEVAFELRFPKLFFIESRIGEFQLLVMKDFPDSKLALQRQFIFAAGEDKTLQDIAAGQKNEQPEKIWQFTSSSGVRLSVMNSRLTLSSQTHKTYRFGDADRFRDVVASVTDKFFKIIAVPLITRIGLRYIDACPATSKTIEAFRSYYNSVLPLDRFPIEATNAMEFTTVVDRKGCKLRYVESLEVEPDVARLTLDFDAWSENIEPAQVLTVTDSLHDTICDEFVKTIKEPVFTYMRKPKGT